MTITRLVCISVLLFAASCSDKGGDKSKRINLIEKSPIKLNDTSYGPFYKNKYFLPYVIRLNKPSGTAFIQVDTALNNTKKLENNNREEYYSKVIALLPQDDLQAHRAVWALPEMKNMQQADGGYGTIVTWIKERLDKKSGYYIIEVRRNDIEQLSLVKGTSFFRVRLHPLHIEIADESGYFVSLDAWRRSRK